MAAFYKFLSSYEVLIYILLAIAGLFSFRWMFASWNEFSIAIYKLEKEFSGRRLAQSSAISAVIVIVFCFVFFMTSFVIPSLPAEVFLSTPTINFLATPTGTLSAEMMTQFAGVQQLQPAAANAAGCVPGKIDITSPAPGDEVKGIIDLVGTVNIPNFGFYKYEVAPAGGDTWATISAGRTVVVDGSLGRWNATALTPGDYQLRLVVTDNQGAVLPACIIPIRVTPAQ